MMPKRIPKSMSNTLSLTFDDITIPQPKLFPNNLNVSDTYVKPPCHDEFMELIACLNKKSSCKKEYASLLKCIKKDL
mgnify:CR=1 FL=1